ncbi:hypothetical protein MXB_4421 [Myxobolus squamalis]|nr:hypothetical protein MXB_4421 [Myxobolus squamalis]
MADCQSGYQFQEPRIFYGVENLLEIYSNNELPSPDWLVEFNELICDEKIEPKLLEGSSKPRIVSKNIYLKQETPNSHIKTIERNVNHFGPPRTNYFKQEFNKDKYFKIPIAEPPKSAEIWEAKPCEDYIYDGRRPIPKKKNLSVIKTPESEILNPEPQILNAEPEIYSLKPDSLKLKVPREEPILITHYADVKIDAVNYTSLLPIQDTLFTTPTYKDLPNFCEPDTFYDQKEKKLEEAPSSNTPKYAPVYSGPFSTFIPVKHVPEKPTNKFEPTRNKNLGSKNCYSQPPIYKKYINLNHGYSSISNSTQPKIEVTAVKTAASSPDSGACFWKNTEPEIATDFNEIIKIQQIEQNEEKKELIQKLKELPKIKPQPKPKNLHAWNTIQSPKVSSLKDIMKEEQRNNDLKKIKDPKISSSSKNKTRATNISQVPDKEPLVKKKSSNDQLFWNSAVDKSNKK